MQALLGAARMSQMRMEALQPGATWTGQRVVREPCDPAHPGDRDQWWASLSVTLPPCNHLDLPPAPSFPQDRSPDPQPLPYCAVLGRDHCRSLLHRACVAHEWSALGPCQEPPSAASRGGCSSDSHRASRRPGKSSRDSTPHPAGLWLTRPRPPTRGTTWAHEGDQSRVPFMGQRRKG